MVPSTLIPLNFSLFLQLLTITSFPKKFPHISYFSWVFIILSRNYHRQWDQYFSFYLYFLLSTVPRYFVFFIHPLSFPQISCFLYLFPPFHFRCPLWIRKETRLFLFFMVLVIINCDISHSFPEFMINNVKRGYSFDMKHILKFNVILWFENLFIFSLLFPTMRNMRKGKVKYPIKN